MGFEQYGGYAKLGYEVAEHWNLYGDVNVTHFNASYPGPITAPLLDGDQRITRGVTSFAMENRYEKTSGAWSFFYNWAPPTKLRNASLSSISGFFVLADSAELPIRQSSETV